MISLTFDSIPFMKVKVKYDFTDAFDCILFMKVKVKYDFTDV